MILICDEKTLVFKRKPGNGGCCTEGVIQRVCVAAGNERWIIKFALNTVLNV